MFLRTLMLFMIHSNDSGTARILMRPTDIVSFRPPEGHEGSSRLPPRLTARGKPAPSLRAGRRFKVLGEGLGTQTDAGQKVSGDNASLNAAPGTLAEAKGRVPP